MKKVFLLLLGLFRKLNLWKLKLQGKTMQDVHEARILTGKAWEEYCDTIKAAGAAMLFPGSPKDAFNQAEGYRYLGRLVCVNWRKAPSLMPLSGEAACGISETRPGGQRFGDSSPNKDCWGCCRIDCAPRPFSANTRTSSNKS